jgi:hypothetical protein
LDKLIEKLQDDHTNMLDEVIKKLIIYNKTGTTLFIDTVLTVLKNFRVLKLNQTEIFIKSII